MAKNRFGGKRVVVAGGSSGIGRAIALQLTRAGAHVVIAARGKERLVEVTEELKAARASSEQHASHVVFDAAVAESIHDAVNAAVEQLGGLDWLFANQGYAATGYFEDAPSGEFEAMMRTNYLGHVELTRAALPHLKQGGGAVCLTSSMLGFMGTIGYSAYGASKHAIVGFARCIRGELKQHGISVTLGYVPTTDTPGLVLENRDKPADTWAIEASSKKFSPEYVAAVLVDGTSRGRFEVTPGFSSRLIWRLYRWLPGLVDYIVDRDVAAFHRKELAAGRDPRRPALLR